MFPTQYRDPIRFNSNVGSPVKVLYSPEFDDRGVMRLVESGRENLYDYIQSHRDSVDIHKIMQRFQDGDVSALSKVQGEFGDFSDYPRSYAELLNKVLAGEQSFNQLPLDVRDKFGHSYERWLASAGSSEWVSAMGLDVDPKPASKPPEEAPKPPVEA